MKYLSQTLFLLLVVLLSCRDKDDISPNRACGVRDPLNNLAWLKTQMDNFRQKKQEEITYVTATEVNGQQYIQVYQSFMSCSFCVLYNCDGSRADLSKLSSTEFQAFMEQYNKPSNRVQLWPKQ